MPADGTPCLGYFTHTGLSVSIACISLKLQVMLCEVVGQGSNLFSYRVIRIIPVWVKV